MHFFGGGELLGLVVPHQEGGGHRGVRAVGDDFDFAVGEHIPRFVIDSCAVCGEHGDAFRIFIHKFDDHIGVEQGFLALLIDTGELCRKLGLGAGGIHEYHRKIPTRMIGHLHHIFKRLLLLRNITFPVAGGENQAEHNDDFFHNHLCSLYHSTVSRMPSSMDICWR